MSTRIKQRPGMYFGSSQYLSTDNAEQLSPRSYDASCDEASPNRIPKFIIEEIQSAASTSPCSLAPPDVFVDKFGDNPQRRLSFDLLKVPNKGPSSASLYSSVYMTPCASISSINTTTEAKSTKSQKGSLHSLNFDKYLNKIIQKRKHFSRRKSLSEGDLTAISCFPMSSLGSGSVTQSRRPINRMASHNSFSYLMLPDESVTARSRLGSLTDV